MMNKFLITFENILKFIKKHWKALFIIIGIIFICFIGIILVTGINNYISNKLNFEKQKLIKDNNQLIKQKDKEIEIRNKKLLELEKERDKYYTEQELIKLNSNKKNKIILKLQKENKELLNIIDNDTNTITELKNALDKTNKEYAKTTIKKNEFNLFVMGGVDNKFNVDVYAGVTYNRTLLNTKIIDVGISLGGAVKVYENIGGSGILGGFIKF